MVYVTTMATKPCKKPAGGSVSSLGGLVSNSIDSKVYSKSSPTYDLTNNTDIIITRLTNLDVESMEIVSKLEKKALELSDSGYALKVYGTVQKPMFCIRDVEVWMKKSNIRQLLSNDRKSELEYRKYIPLFDYLKANSLSVGDKNPKKRLFFTFNGFCKYLMVSEGLLANRFREYIVCVLEQLREKGYATLKESTRKWEIQAQKKKELFESIRKTNSILEEEFGAMAHQIKFNKSEMRAVELRNQILESQNQKLIEDSSYMEEIAPDIKKQERELLRELFLKPIGVFLVNPRKLAPKSKKPSKTKSKASKSKKPSKLTKSKTTKTKSKASIVLPESESKTMSLQPIDSDSDSDFDSGVPGTKRLIRNESESRLQYDFKSYQKIGKDAVIPDRRYYFRVSTVKTLKSTIGMRAGEIRYVNKKHLDNFKKSMSEKYPTHISGTYECTFNEMTEMASSTLIKALKSLKESKTSTE
jgi:hypothetical protein